MSGVAGVASVLLLARAMDVQSYAGYTALTGLIVMIAILSGLGMERAIARYIPEGRIQHSPRQLGGFVWKLSLFRFMTAVVAAIGLYVLWPQVLQVFANTLHLNAFPWSLVCFFLANVMFDHFSFILQALVLQKVLTRTLVIQWGGRLVLIANLFYRNGVITLEQALWILAIPEIAGVLVLLLIVRNYLINLTRYVKKPEIGENKWPQWKKVLGMSLHNYGFNLLASIPQGYFMRMLAAALLPADLVAAYGFFLTIIERFRQYLPVQLLYSMMEPILISKYLVKKDFKQLNHRLNIFLYIFLSFFSLSLFNNFFILFNLLSDFL